MTAPRKKKSSVPVAPLDLRTLLFCSMRYSLGRQTYMPSLVQDLIKAHKDVLTKDDFKQLADEIIEYHGKSNGKMGADFDTRDWLLFREWLLREYEGQGTP